MAGFKGRLPLPLAAAAAPQVWSGCTLQGHTSPSSTLPSYVRFARPVMAIFTAEGLRSSHSVCMLCTMYIVHGIHIQNSSICQQHYNKQDRPTEILVKKKVSPTIVRINQSTIDEQKGHQRWR